MQGLMPVWINRSSGKFQGRELLTVGAMADSYYEYLLKTWLYTRKQVCGSRMVSRNPQSTLAIPWHPS